jgi:hypothetical protein
MTLPDGIKHKVEHTHTYDLPELITLTHPNAPEYSAELFRVVISIYWDGYADVDLYGYPLTKAGKRHKGGNLERLYGYRDDDIVDLLTADALERSGFPRDHVPTDEED